MTFAQLLHPNFDAFHPIADLKQWLAAHRVVEETAEPDLPEAVMREFRLPHHMTSADRYAVAAVKSGSF